MFGIHYVAEYVQYGVDQNVLAAPLMQKNIWAYAAIFCVAALSILIV